MICFICIFIWLVGQFILDVIMFSLGAWFSRSHNRSYNGYNEQQCDCKRTSELVHILSFTITIMLMRSCGWGLSLALVVRRRAQPVPFNFPSLDNCSLSFRNKIIIPWLKKVIWVIEVLRRTVVGNQRYFSRLQSPRWSFSIKLCYSWFQNIYFKYLLHK